MGEGFAFAPEADGNNAAVAFDINIKDDQNDLNRSSLLSVLDVLSGSELLISRIETWACRLPLTAPIDFGSFVARERHYAAVRVHTHDGLTADCLAQTRGSPVDIVLAEVLAPLLVHKSAFDIESRRLEVARTLTALELDGAIGRAWSLCEICLQDLRSQAAGIPLWRMLGGSPRQVPVLLVEGYSLVEETADGFAERLARRVSEGFRAIKVEAAHYSGSAEVLRRLELFRKKAGFDCALVLDFAWSWPDPASKRDLLAGLEELKVEWLEDPFPRHSIRHYRELKTVCKLPVGCGDESTRPSDLFALIDAGAIDVVRIDATTIGGVSAARQIASHGRSCSRRVSFHERPEVHEHCVFGFDSADHVEIFPVDRPFDCAHEILEEPVASRVTRGFLEPGHRPGTGIRLRADALERWAWRHTEIGS